MRRMSKERMDKALEQLKSISEKDYENIRNSSISSFLKWEPSRLPK
jgi:hypothetical protein